MITMINIHNNASSNNNNNNNSNKASSTEAMFSGSLLQERHLDEECARLAETRLARNS